MSIGEHIADFFSYFNPFEKSFHSRDSFSKLSGFEKAETIFFTVVGAVFGLGIGGLAAFRFCAKQLSAEDQKTVALAKSVLQPQMMEAIEKGQWEKLNQLWQKNIGRRPGANPKDLEEVLELLKKPQPDETSQKRQDLDKQIAIVQEAITSYRQDRKINLFKYLQLSEIHSLQQGQETADEIRTLQQAIVIGDSRLFHQAINMAEKKGLDPKELLKQLSPTLAHNPLASDFLKRIIASFDVLITFGADRAKLSVFEMLRITCVAENALQEGGKKNIRLKKSEVGLARSVLVDFAKKNFTVIQGKHGEIKAEGAFGKVRSTIEVSIKKIGENYQAAESEISETVRKTLLKQNERTKRTFEPGEITYEEKYGELRTRVLYLQKGVEKESISFKAYPYTLDSYIKQKGFSDTELYQVMDQVTKTLEAMHNDNVVHLDVKAENILFKPPGSAKLGDFGFASAIDSSQPVNRHATPLCVSPEIVLGDAIPREPQYQKAQDMFGLGVTLYHCITNKEVPWQGILKKWKTLGANRKSPIKAEISKALDALDPNHPFTPLAKRLLDPNMHTRMTIAECRQELAKIQSHLR